MLYYPNLTPGLPQKRYELYASHYLTVTVSILPECGAAGGDTKLRPGDLYGGGDAGEVHPLHTSHHCK